MGIFSKKNELNKLIEHYPAAHDPGQPGQIKQTVKVGVVRYRRCVTVSILEEGLFLWVRSPFGRKVKLLIPWYEIKQVRKSRLYGLQGMCLSIGEPEVGEITVYQELFERMRMYFRGMEQEVEG